MEVHALSSPSFVLYDQLRDELAVLSQASQLRAQIAEGFAPSGCSDKDGLLMFQGHIFLPDDPTLWPVVLEHAHTMGHEGGEKTLHRFRAVFCSPHVRCRVREYIHSCEVCQRNKTNIFIRQVYYNLFPFLIKFGVILP
jgi:hypothetical protein